MARDKVRVLIFGVGAIGGMIAKELLNRPERFEIVGVVDKDPSKAGRDLGEVLGLSIKTGITVTESLDNALARGRPDVAIHATTSYLEIAFDQISEIVKRGISVISTCEELFYPVRRNRKLAERLDSLAKESGASILGAGINPGFLMDVLPVVLTAACLRVDKIRVTRVINASERRLPFQRKIGVGLTVEEFKNKIKSREISGHVGLRESLTFIADSLGWEIEKVIEEEVTPVIADGDIDSELGLIEKGRVIGLQQVMRGESKEEEKVVLDFRAYLGAEGYDEIIIEGVPPIRQTIKPCVHGDRGTAAVVVNSIPRVLEARAGLLTMRDLTLVHFSP